MTQLYVLSGPNTGKAFDLKDGSTYVGRSLENDIQLEDRTISRKHLKIIKRGSGYSITDLESQNGTLYKGNFIAQHVELPIQEGVPIAIGMSVICLGEGCIEQMMPFLDSVGLSEEIGGESTIFQIHKGKTNQKKLELIYKVSSLLDGHLPIDETLAGILVYILDLLKIVETGAFIHVDPVSEKILGVVSKTMNHDGDNTTVYCPDVVRRVIEERKPVIISNAETEEEVDFVKTLKILKIQSVLCAPLISNSQLVGVIYLSSQKRPFWFTKGDMSLFVDLCQRTALYLMQARLAFESTTIADVFPPHASPPI